MEVLIVNIFPPLLSISFRIAANKHSGIYTTTSVYQMTTA